MTFAAQRAAALALLTNPDVAFNRKTGSFLGQMAVVQAPMSIAQRNWLSALLEQVGLPAYSERAWGDEST